MRINILFLDYLRHDFTDRVMAHNFSNAGHPYDYMKIDRKGISAAINYGLQMSKDYDAVITMANDIIMPDNWLNRMVEAARAIPNTGMCGIHCVEGISDKQVTINGVNIRIANTSFGNVLIPMQAVRTIGYFNPDYDPYGMQDSDYAYRLNCTGHINYYLDGLKSDHIGHDVGNGSEYRKMKDDGLSTVDAKWLKWTKHYEETKNYTIDLNDWPDAQD